MAACQGAADGTGFSGDPYFVVESPILPDQYNQGGKCRFTDFDTTTPTNFANLFRYGDSCPEGKEFNTDTGICDDPPYECSPGELANGCAVDCPSVVYTYTLNGKTLRGHLGYGQVGYGQTCPQPSFPPGSGDACIGNVVSEGGFEGACGGPDFSSCPCTNFGSATNETESQTETTTTETTDGNTTTTTKETKTTEGVKPKNPNPGSGGPAIDTGGKVVDPNTEGLSPETQNIGDKTFAKCTHGGLVDGVAGCDYNPQSCTTGQVAAYFGCVDIPKNDPPPTPAKEQKTVTTDPQTGEVTTTETKTSGTSDSKSSSGGGGAAQEEKKPEETFGGGANCETAPVCAGSAIQCGIANQTWRMRCAHDDASKTITDISNEIAADSKYQSIWVDSEENDFSDKADDILDQPGFLGTSTCPPDRTFNSNLVGSINISYSFLCQFASTLSGLVLLLAGIVAARNVARVI